MEMYPTEPPPRIQISPLAHVLSSISRRQAVFAEHGANLEAWRCYVSETFSHGCSLQIRRDEHGTVGEGKEGVCVIPYEVLPQYYAKRYASGLRAEHVCVLQSREAVAEPTVLLASAVEFTKHDDGSVLQQAVNMRVTFSVANARIMSLRAHYLGSAQLFVSQAVVDRSLVALHDKLCSSVPDLNASASGGADARAVLESVQMLKTLYSEQPRQAVEMALRQHERMIDSVADLKQLMRVCAQSSRSPFDALAQYVALMQQGGAAGSMANPDELVQQQHSPSSETVSPTDAFQRVQHGLTAMERPVNPVSSAPQHVMIRTSNQSLQGSVSES